MTNYYYAKLNQPYESLNDFDRADWRHAVLSYGVKCLPSGAQDNYDNYRLALTYRELGCIGNTGYMAVYPISDGEYNAICSGLDDCDSVLNVDDSNNDTGYLLGRLYALLMDALRNCNSVERDYGVKVSLCTRRLFDFLFDKYREYGNGVNSDLVESIKSRIYEIPESMEGDKYFNSRNSFSVGFARQKLAISK